MIQNFSVGGWNGGLAELTGFKPVPFYRGCGTRGSKDPGGNAVTGIGIGDLIEGFSIWSDFRESGEEPEASPPLVGMLLGQPDGCATPDDEDRFFLGAGGRFQAGGGRDLFLRGARPLQGARRTVWIFGKADQSSQLHEGLVVNSWIFFGD